MIGAAVGEAIAQGLYADGPPARLIGGEHRELGHIVFPMPGGSEAALYAPKELSPVGTVWSWTIQRFRPKSPPYAGPEAFVPFVMAYVELPGEVIVASRLVEVGLDEVSIGMPVETTIIPLDPAAADSPMIPAFRPRKAECEK